MKKLGTKNNPIRFRVSNESKFQKIAEICNRKNWTFIAGIEPDEPEDISEFEYMLNPKAFGGKPPEMKNTYNATVVNSEPKIGRNDPCICGSGKKYKKCCLN